MEQQEELDYHIYRDYQIMQKVGKGTYGVVYKARHKKTNRIIAIKKIIDAFQNLIDAKRTYRELNYLLQLQHPCIVTLECILPLGRKGHQQQPSTSRLAVTQPLQHEERGSTTDKLFHSPLSQPKHLYAVFEFVEADLGQILKQCDSLQPIQRKYIAYQLLQGINYLHSSGLVHRDIKPSNLLINCATLQTKICDFGMARLKTKKQGSNSDGVLTEYVASRWYRPPQTLLGITTCQDAIDLWSAGCVIAELILKTPIFPGKNTLDQLQFIFRCIGMPSVQEVAKLRSQSAKLVINNFTFSKRCKYRSLQEMLSFSNHLEVDLIMNLLAFDPSGRITAQQAMNHEYFDEIRELMGPRKITPASIVDYSLEEKDKKKSNIQGIEYYRMLISELEKYGERASNHSLPVIVQKELDKEELPIGEEPELKEKSTKESGCVNILKNYIMNEEKKQFSPDKRCFGKKGFSKNKKQKGSQANLHKKGREGRNVSLDKTREEKKSIVNVSIKKRQSKGKQQHRTKNKSKPNINQIITNVHIHSKTRSHTLPEKTQEPKIQRNTSQILKKKESHKGKSPSKSQHKQAKERKQGLVSEQVKNMMKPLVSKSTISKCSSKKKVFNFKSLH